MFPISASAHNILLDSITGDDCRKQFPDTGTGHAGSWLHRRTCPHGTKSHTTMADWKKNCRSPRIEYYSRLARASAARILVRAASILFSQVLEVGVNDLFHVTQDICQAAAGDISIDDYANGYQ